MKFIGFNDFSTVTKTVTGLKIGPLEQEQRDRILCILFNDDEGACYGTTYSKVVNRIPIQDTNQYEFLSINPLDKTTDHMWFMNDEKYKEDVPRRCDWNVTCFRNFMFEMDETPLEQQREILENCNIPWSSVVFSGNKSYHAILSVDGGIDAAIASIPGLDLYKYTWKKLAAQINETASELFGERDGGYVDHSSKNPSRFTRFPLSFRADKSTIQHIVHIGERISRDRFVHLLESCPFVEERSKSYFNTPENLTTTEKEFFRHASKGLESKLKLVNWGASSGMYFELYRLTLWAIDDTNVDRETFLDILWKYTFPRLIEDYNYPSEKCEIGVIHAFNKKFPGVYNVY